MLQLGDAALLDLLATRDQHRGGQARARGCTAKTTGVTLGTGASARTPLCGTANARTTSNVVGWTLRLPGSSLTDAPPPIVQTLCRRFAEPNPCVPPGMVTVAALVKTCS